jgi:polyisoprenoid-binding protein YceI
MAWELDKVHSEIGFAVRHLMISTVRGKFRDFSVRIEGEPVNADRGAVEITIDTASIDTNDGQRDGHLRSPDFFDSEKHPKMVFRATSLVESGSKYVVRGDLTIRGVSKPVQLEAQVVGPAKDPWGNERFGVSAQGEVDREDWGLVWNLPLDSGGVVVGKTVKLHVELELIRV